MRLRCYIFSKKQNSTAIPPANADYVSFDFVFKTETSLLNPEILLDTSFSIYLYDYFYIEELHLYYFRDGIESVNGNMFRLHLKLDKAGSYRAAILGYTAFIERCADSRYYNTDIPDDALSVEDMIEHVASASTYCNFSSGLLYVVRIMGRDSTGGIGSFVTNLHNMQNIFSQMWVDIDNGLGLGDLEEFMQMWIADPIKYVIGLYSTPIGASVYASNVSTETVYFGGHETNISWDRINNGNVVMFSGALSKPTGIYTDFRRTDPAFSSYTIYIPTVGTVPLAADLIERNLSMEIGADLLSGDLLFKLKADGDIVASYASNCYATQSLGVVNQANGVMSGALSALGAIPTGNIGGAIAGIKTAMSPSPSIISSQGGTGCVSVANEIVITCCQKSSAEFPVGVYGRPCCKNLQLQNLSGFVKCAQSSLPLAVDDSTRTELNAMLDSGIYIE